MISWATNTVHMVVAAPSVALTMLPSGAINSMARNVPSLRGMSGSKKDANAVVDAGAGIGPGAVLESPDLRTRAAQVDPGAVALDCETNPHRHVARLEAVVVGVIGALVDPVWQGGDGHAHPAFGVVEYAVEQRQRISTDTSSANSATRSAPDSGGAEHRAEVSVLQLGRARIDEQQPPEVAADLAPGDELHGREANPLLPRVAGQRIVGARSAAPMSDWCAGCRRRRSAGRRRRPASRPPSRAGGCRRRATDR